MPSMLLLVQLKKWQQKWECHKQISNRDWKLLPKHSEKQWKVAQDLVRHLALQWKPLMEHQIPVLIWDLLLPHPQLVTWRM
jgi:hypothetical protein